MAHAVNFSDLYGSAKNAVIENGFEHEILWQEMILGTEISETNFLREAGWVILCSGFRESVVRRIFRNFSLCFCDWESAEVIVENEDICMSSALNVFPNLRKVSAILDIARLVHEEGFYPLLCEIQKDPIEKLKQLPHIGAITSYHLAKNLGFNVSKPDRHLIRIAERLGFSNVHSLCSEFSRLSGDEPSVVDIVLWRFAVLTSGKCWEPS